MYCQECGEEIDGGIKYCPNCGAPVGVESTGGTSKRKGKSSSFTGSSATSLDIKENVEGALCYLLGWLTGVLFFLLEKKSDFVKFHAMQSIVVFLPLTILSAFLWYMSMLFGLLGFLLWLLLMIKAYQGKYFRLPIAGEIAEELIAEFK